MEIKYLKRKEDGYSLVKVLGRISRQVRMLYNIFSSHGL